MSTLEFPPQEYLDPIADLIVFPAVLEGGRAVPCAVEVEALQQTLMAGAGDPLPVFRASRPMLESVAARLIAQGRFEHNGGILIGAADL